MECISLPKAFIQEDMSKNMTSDCKNMSFNVSINAKRSCFDMIGPFIFIFCSSTIKKGQSFDDLSMILFTPNYLPKVGGKHIVILQSNVYSDISHLIQFETADAMNLFLRMYYKSLTDLQNTILENSKNIKGLMGTAKCLFKGDRSIKKCNIILLHQFGLYSIQVHGPDSDDEYMCYLDMNFGSSSIVSPLIYVPNQFKKSDQCLLFSICDINTGNETIFKCDNVNDALKWILHMHMWIILSTTNLDLQKDSLHKKRAHSNENISPKKLVGVDEKAENKPFIENCEDVENQLKIVIEEIVVNKIKLHSPKGSSYTVADSPKKVRSPNCANNRANRIPRSSRRLRVTQKLSSTNDIPDKKREKTKILDESLKNLRKFSCDSIPRVFKPLESKENMIVSSYLNQTSVNSTIEAAINLLAKPEKKPSSNITEENMYSAFEKCDERTFDEVLSSACRTPLDSIDLSKYVRLSDFPNFNFDELENVKRPVRPIVEEFSLNLQLLIESNKNKIKENTITVRLCFLVSALFLNGLKQFNSFGQEKVFLEALYDLVPYVNGLESIYEAVSLEQTILTQISKFSALMLNGKSLVPVLEAILREDEWLSEFYSQTSFLRDEDTIRMLIYCLPMINILNFDLNEESSMIITSIPNEDKLRYIFRPAYSHLRFDEIRNNIDDQKVKKEIVQVMLNEFNYKAERKGWQFLTQLVVNPHVKLNCDFRLLRKSIRETKTMSSDENKIKYILKMGVKYGLLHIWFIIMITNKELTKQFFSADSFFVDMYRSKCVIVALSELMNKYSY